MNLININREWELKSAEYKILFRKPIALNEYDKVLLKLLCYNDGSLDKDELGLLLGFGMRDDRTQNLYKDNAEIEIYNHFLDELKKFKLIEEARNILNISDWGSIALETGNKYIFHEGTIKIYDHIHLYQENEHNLFPFYRFPIDVEISEIRKVDKYQILENEITNLLLDKVKFNFKSDKQSDYIIDCFISDKAKLGKTVTEITINLKNEDSDKRIETAVNNKVFVELNELLYLEENKDTYNDLLFYAEYALYLRDTEKIDAATLSRYRNYVDWSEIIKDKRINWTEDMFHLLTEEDISNGSLWIDVVKNCPLDILREKLENYRDFLNWSELTTLFETPFIIETYNNLPWDTDILIDRAAEKEIEFLLENNLFKDTYIDWSILTNKISDSFLVKNIDTINFDLLFFTKERTELCQELIIQYPDKSWNWREIVSNYDLTYLLHNIEKFVEKLDIEILLIRFLNTNDELFQSFKNNSIIVNQIEKTLYNKDSFYISGVQNVKLDLDRLIFLENFDLLFWGDETAIGVEVNKGINWDYLTFSRYNKKVVSHEGKKIVSLSIQDLSIIDSNEYFEWNWDELSKRKNFINDIEFIKRHKDQLNFQNIIYAVPVDLLKYEFLYFKDWATSSEAIESLISCIEERLSLLNLFTIIITYELYETPFDWKKIIKEEDEQALENIILLHQITISKISNQNNLIYFLTQKLSIDFILNHDNLSWNWDIITKDKLSNEQLKDKDILRGYSKKLNWTYIFDEVYNAEELSIEEELPELVNIISSNIKGESEAWHIITKKQPTYELWKAIDKTEIVPLYKWDWDYISSSNKIFNNFSIKNLEHYSSKINWNELSQNVGLNDFWRYSKDNYKDYATWEKSILKYLVEFKNKWNFKLLSSISNITWSWKVIDRFIDRWDWDILSKERNLLTRKQNNKIVFNLRNLKNYSEKINWQILSTRNEVTIDEKLLNRFSDKSWDYSILSSHPNLNVSIDFIVKKSDKEWNWTELSKNKKLALSIEVLSKTHDKKWDWNALTKRSDIHLDKDILLARKVENGKIDYLNELAWVSTKTWDWEFLSRAKWIDGELLKALPNQKWDWKIISENRNIIFDKSLVELLIEKENVNWDSIFSNPRSHINPEVLRLLENKIDLSEKSWNIISNNKNLNLNKEFNDDIQFDYDFVDRYIDFWNWDSLVKNEKIDISNIKILRRYEDRLNWELISGLTSFKPTKEILKEFSNKLDWNKLTKKVHLTNDVITKYAEHLNWDYLSTNKEIEFTPELLANFEKKWNYWELKNNKAIELSPTAQKYFKGFVKKNRAFEFYFKLMEQYSNWKGKVYHFTHITNALEIINSQKILSRNKASGFSDAAGSVVGRRHTAHNFARFYFRPRTPTQFYNECLGKDTNSGKNGWTKNSYGEWVEVWKSDFPKAKNLGLPKCPIPVFFQFDLQEVIIKMADKCYASNGNMQTNWAKVYPLKEIISTFNFEDVYSSINNTSDNDWRTYINHSQQEFLIKDFFDFSELQKFKIIVRTKSDRMQLLGLLDENDPIRSKIVVDSSETSIFHNENRRIDYSIKDKIVTISSDYEGDGFAKGLFELEIENSTMYKIKSGNVVSKKDNTIYFYPNIEIDFEEDSFCFITKFHDKVTNKSWEIIKYCNNEK